MDKKELEAVAEQLATSELVCRGMGLIAENTRKAYESYQPKSVFEGKKEKRRLEAVWQDACAQYERSCAQVAELTKQLDSLRAQSEELATKRYWWDVPFRAEEADEPDAYSFSDGIYVETGKVKTALEGSSSVLRHEPVHINYTLLNMRLTDDRAFPLFLNKKQLRLHINDQMEIRHLYNVMSVSGRYEVVSYMNPQENPAAAIWRNYQAQTESRRAEYDEYLRGHEETWDMRERIRHGSLYTNEERWFAGRMSNEDYLRENLWREYPTWDKRDKMNNDLSNMRWRAEKARLEAQKSFVKSRKDAVYETNLLRVMPVGECIYCADELMAILVYTQPQAVTEYDCDPAVEITELTGRYFTTRELFRKKPALIPLLRHIATVYADILPDYRVLKPCPKGCPDDLWRVWAEIRWARKISVH